MCRAQVRLGTERTSGTERPPSRAAFFFFSFSPFVTVLIASRSTHIPDILQACKEPPFSNPPLSLYAGRFRTIFSFLVRVL